MSSLRVKKSEVVLFQVVSFGLSVSILRQVSGKGVPQCKLNSHEVSQELLPIKTCRAFNAKTESGIASIDTLKPVARVTGFYQRRCVPSG